MEPTRPEGLRRVAHSQSLDRPKRNGPVVGIYESGYNLARMAFEIILAPEAVTALKNLSVPVRKDVTEALDRYLIHEPIKVSKSRIKRLRGLSQPQYRLRVGDIRVFYDVTETQVQVLAIVTKAEAQAWLDEQGTPTADAP
jgi:mRNA interferase RelE/StbE